jgi:hypothetical protein
MFHEHITICSVGFTGALSDCINHADVNRTFSGPVGVALNADRTKLYVANISYNELDYDGDGSISICPLEGGGDSFTDCTKKLDDTFRTVTSIMLNEDNTYAYITSAGSPGQSYTDASVFICPLDEDGSFDGDCVASSGSGTFRNPRSSVIDPDGKLRVVNAYNNTISLCDLSDDQSTIVSCTTITNVTFNNVQGIGYNNAGTFFYIPNVDADQISICNDNECIVQPNGQENDPEFSFSDGYDGYKVGVFMSSANGKGYITNSGNGTVSVCTINATTGLLSDCANTYVTPYPADIVLGAGT